MFTYVKDYQESKKELFEKVDEIKTKGYKVTTSKQTIVDDLAIDKIIIHSKEKTTDRFVINLGLHGIEGYVGHACLMTFFDELFDTLNPTTEVVIYHPVNPYGMANYRRTNENNIDLNRNFTNNNFTSENPGYVKAHSFFTPRSYKGVKRANIHFYSSLVKLLFQFGISSFKEATLLGQKTLPEGVYYSGSDHQASTKYMLDQIPLNLKDVKQLVWIDLHTGYGPRYQMSIVNSKYEKESTLDIIKHIDYPLVLGLNKEDFYEIDGDMIEMIYSINQKQENPIEMYATCFEFGTLGHTTLNMIESLKATIFENANNFKKQTPKFNEYASVLIKEQFMPSEEKWREKAYLDFKKATSGIIKHKNM